jgi:hypothetical protein
VEAGLFLSHRIRKLEVSWSLLHSHGGFPNSSARCSVKCVRGVELPFDSFLTVVVFHVTLLASIPVFHCVFVIPNLVLMTDSFSIAMQSWSS